jgi:hypothetical protein
LQIFLGIEALGFDAHHGGFDSTNRANDEVGLIKGDFWGGVILWGTDGRVGEAIAVRLKRRKLLRGWRG